MPLFISKEPGDWIYNAQMMSPLWTHVRLTCHPPPPKILKTLNACHVFLKVIALVDTTDGTGNLVLPYSLQGIRHSDWWSSYTWPHQIRLLPKAWRTWRKNIYIQFYIAIISNRLQRPLEILQQNRPLIQKWLYFVNLSSKHLFQGLEAARTFMHFLLHTHPGYSIHMQSLPFLSIIPSSSGPSDFTMYSAHSKTSTLS